MYHSPVPLIVIRCPLQALIEVNGRIIGECGPDSHAALPAGDSGDYYITASPLAPGRWQWPITRKLVIEKGAALTPRWDDVSFCAWPGGVYELTFDPGGPPASPGPNFPRELDQLSYSIGRQRRTLTLYWEDGLKLLCEEDSRPASCISLGQGEYGTLALYTASGRQFAAVSTRHQDSCRLLLLDGRLQSALELSSHEIRLEESCIQAIDGIGTLMGHQRRVRYTCSAGSFSADPPETGFFTREYSFPQDRRSLVTAFCEAVREGFEEEALSYAAPSLRDSSSFPEIKDFLGNFSSCRPPLSDKDGALMGLIHDSEDGSGRARLYEFSFEDGLISDIAEA